MIHSNCRKLRLSGWLKNNHQKAYDTPLKFQKFLLLYEAFSKVSGEKSDFSNLKGYERGPVFSTVWGDYTKERNAFDKSADRAFASSPELIDNERAEKCAFIVSTSTENELSELTHSFNLWNCKKDRILAGEYQVALDEKDFNDHDADMVKALDQMYPIEEIRNSRIISTDRHYFVFHKDDYARLTEEQMDTLFAISNSDDELHNPVYVEIDEDGRLLID